MEPAPAFDGTSLAEATFFRGRVALYAILEALGIGAGETVALQAFTCVAVPEGIAATGAKPRFIDITDNGFTMDPKDLIRKLTSQTKAIVLQHTFGIPAHTEAVKEIADGRGIPVIEDCCHTYLSAVNGRRVGSFGAASFYSFEWGKPLVAGMGGSAISSDDRLRNTLLRHHGALQEPPRSRDLRIEVEYLGYRIMFRPTLYWIAKRLKGALGNLQVVESSYNGRYGEGASSDFMFRMAPSSRRRLTRIVGGIQRVGEHSDWITAQYRGRIASPYITHPVPEPGSRVVFGRYPLTTPHKKAIMQLARRHMVEVAGWYSTPVHPLTFAQWEAIGYLKGACPNAERRAEEVLTLPTHIKVTQRDIDRTVDFFNGLRL